MSSPTPRDFNAALSSHLAEHSDLLNQLLIALDIPHELNRWKNGYSVRCPICGVDTSQYCLRFDPMGQPWCVWLINEGFCHCLEDKPASLLTFLRAHHEPMSLLDVMNAALDRLAVPHWEWRDYVEEMGDLYL